MMLVHATAVAIGPRAVLLTGASGCGKSDLALRLIDRGAQLIADDQVWLDALLHASPPATLAGLIEVRGIGVVGLPWTEGVRIALVVDLDTAPARMPEPAFRRFAAIAVPCVALAAFEASAALKVEQALKRWAGAVETAP